MNYPPEVKYNHDPFSESRGPFLCSERLPPPACVVMYQYVGKYKMEEVPAIYFPKVNSFIGAFCYLTPDESTCTWASVDDANIQNQQWRFLNPNEEIIIEGT